MRSVTSLASLLRTLALATAGVVLGLAQQAGANGPFCSTPGSAIPNLGTVSNDQVVGASGTIGDLNVSVDISHTWVGDLRVTLTHVGTGTSVIIIDRPGIPPSTFGCSQDDILATLDDEAAVSVEGQCAGSAPTIAGTFIPNNPLSAFDGESIAGTWRLTVDDLATGDVGTLNGWCLLPTSADSDGDGVLDADDVCPGTVKPESVPTVALLTNRFALINGDTLFDTVGPKGGGQGPQASFSLQDTAGCSCEQIIAALGLGEGHTKFGCSLSAMRDWIELVNP